MYIDSPSSPTVGERLTNIEHILQNIQTQYERQNYIIQSMFSMINTINNTLIMFHNYYKEIMYSNNSNETKQS
jgi:hypothetical protein